KKIYASFSKTEVRYLKNYLTAFHNKGRNKSLELIELIEKYPDWDQAKLSQHLYGDPQSKAFLMMRKRLLEKMIETLSLSINFHNNPTFKGDPPAYESIAILKDYMYALFLRRRGLEKLAVELLERCVQKAEQFAMPEYKMLALASLRSVVTKQKELDEYLHPELEQSLTAYENDLFAGGIDKTFRLMTDQHPVFDAERIQYLEEQTALLEAKLAEQDSPRARYFYLNLKLQLANGKEDYQLSTEIYQALIHHIETNKGLKSRNRLGIPYLRLASIELYQEHFHKGLEAAEEALKLFPPRKYNYLQASICKLFACCYLGLFEEAEACINSLAYFIETPPKRHLRPVLLALDWIHYFRSCLAFFRGEYRLALDLLGNVDELFTDKKGWNIDLRIHEIIILIERNQLDLAAARIEALRKHMSKYDVGGRPSHIFQYLYHLERQAFDFGAEGSEMHEALVHLRESLPWDAVNAEVIRFEVWVEAKQKGTDYFPLFRQSLAQTV
ncbi:MAG: hypothetical protein AAGM67_02920, partial [Bacteroidota bacterium]